MKTFIEPQVQLVNLCAPTNLLFKQVFKSLEEAFQQFSNLAIIETDLLSYSFFIFDEDTKEEELSNQIMELKDQNVKIILIDLNKTPLPFFKAWRLCNLGIDEMISWQRIETPLDIIKDRFIRWKIVEKTLVDSIKKYKLIGEAHIWKKFLRQIVETACFSNGAVLLQGESGTGKELVARLIHNLDKRVDKADLILLDGSAIVSDLSGSEFFGHEKGSFTNAVQMRLGAFALANRGTLFIDEVGELPPSLQPELLRVLQEGAYKKVGSNKWEHTDFRLISATNRLLMEEIELGKFRKDLYYRIAGAVHCLPSLKERVEDIPVLTTFFLKRALKTENIPAMDKYVQQFLLSKKYAGNIRELQHLVTRIAHRNGGNKTITMGDIPMSDRETATIETNANTCQNDFYASISKMLSFGMPLKELKKITANIAMDITIEETEGNLQAAAKRLGVSDRLLQNHIANKKILKAV